MSETYATSSVLGHGGVQVRDLGWGLSVGEMGTMWDVTHAGSSLTQGAPCLCSPKDLFLGVCIPLPPRQGSTPKPCHLCLQRTQQEHMIPPAVGESDKAKGLLTSR